MKKKILLTIILLSVGFLYKYFLSKLAEEKCIRRAVNQAKEDAKNLGYKFYAQPKETIKWCKQVF